MRTHRQIDRVLDECRRFENLRVAAFRGKGELCLNWRVRRLANYTAINSKCDELRRSGSCPYYRAEGVGEDRCYDPLRSRGGSCPYYESIRTIESRRFHVIVLSYPYLLDPELRERLGKLLQDGNLSLIVDEAHNLRKQWLMGHLKTFSLDLLRRYLTNGCWRWRCILSSFMRSGLDSLELPEGYALRATIECEMDEGQSWEGRAILSSIRDEIRKSSRLILRRGDLIFVREPEEDLEHLLAQYRSSALISGTWGGVRVSGEFSGRARYFEIPVGAWGDVKVIIVNDFTTRFEERNRSEYYRLAIVLADLSTRVTGNLGIFTASYDVLEGLLDVGLEHLMPKPLFVEDRDMGASENLEMIERFKGLSNTGAVLLAVQGGRSSEGEDFPGAEMTASVVVGLQLPKPDILEDLQRILWRRFSNVKNPNWLYACRAAVQAAARPVRSPEDTGFIVFADRRFTRCESMMPSWMRARLSSASLEELPELASEFFNGRTHLLHR